ncbi:FHIPEP family type III secretion protein [Escherichia coli]|nr:FHIPEP family type III secretion protein [Escherichia coli]
MVNQLFSNPSVMLLSAAVLGLLGLVPGMPNLVFFAVHCRIAGAGLVDTRTRTKSACRTQTGKKWQRIIPLSKRRGTMYNWKILWEWKWVID